MRILIDLTALSYHMTGIERFALCVTKEMLEQDKENEYILLFRDEVYKDLESYVDDKRVFAKIIHGDQKMLFFQLVIPFALYRIKADRYCFFAFPGPLLFKNRYIYNTIHDMGRWDQPIGEKPLNLFYFKTTEGHALRAARKVFTVSQFSKDRIVAIAGLDPDRVEVVYNGITDKIIDSNSSFDEVKDRYGLPDKYIMFLSTLQPRKNLKLLLEAYSEIKDKVDYGLVLVGRKGWEVDELLHKYSLDKDIIVTGYVPDEEIAVIYKNALCFVFPTLYEGFGIPPVEALAMGCPVISSDSSCMKEILMDRAVFFKDNDKQELTGLLEKLDTFVDTMPRELNDFQKTNYSYSASAEKILKTIV